MASALHLSTLISRSPSSILTYISHLSKSFPAHPFLFSLSHNTQSPDELSNLVKHLTSFSSQTLGCLSAPFPGPYSRFIACSMAVFDPRDVVVFRSTIPGKQQAQVGRWRPVGTHHVPRHEHAYGQFGEGYDLADVKNWEEIWNGNPEKIGLPNELQGLSPDDVESVIYMSDRASEGLGLSLTRFVNASKIELVASSTPFVTGRPFTLFQNQDVYDSGAVGVVLKKKKKLTAILPKAKVSFLDLVAISEPVPITRCEGNMIISLNDQNPTQLLLSHIRSSGLDADLAGILKDNVRFALGVVEDGQLGQVFNITAGDPSRGTISLDSQHSPKQGALVQFFHRKRPTADPLSEQGLYFTPCCSLEPPILNPRSFGLLSVTDDHITSQVDTLVSAGTEELLILGDTFLAASENGFVFSHGKSRQDKPWPCTLPGALVTLGY